MSGETTHTKKPLIRLHPAHVLFLVLVALGALAPGEVESAISGITQWFEHSFGWLVLLVSVFFLGLCSYIAFGPYGHVRLGGADEKPQFSTLSWFAMLFAAGMGAGLVFYGAAEPLLHFVNPPPSMGVITEPAEKARRAMAISFFHWGLHAWALYAMAAITVAYFTFHRHTPLLPSVPITNHPWGRMAIDSFAVLAVVFGLVASLCQGVLQVSHGVSMYLPNMDNGTFLQLIVLGILFLCYMVSASTGIGKGIKILSDINIAVAILLMLFVLFAGPTSFIMESFVSGIGDYLDSFIHLSFNVRHFSDAGGWTESWTITYFLWWISWGPFVGVFIARISRGRTLKEFMLGVILAPTLFSAFWFATMGGTAIYREVFDMAGLAAQATQVEATTYAVLATLPLAEITPLVALTLLFVFLVTSADSGTYVLGMFTSHGDLSPPVRQRLFWGVMVGAVTAAALYVGGTVGFFKSVAVFGAIPFLFIMLLQSYHLIKALKQDWKKEHSERL